MVSTRSYYDRGTEEPTSKRSSESRSHTRASSPAKIVDNQNKGGNQ